MREVKDAEVIRKGALALGVLLLLQLVIFLTVYGAIALIEDLGG